MPHSQIADQPTACPGAVYGLAGSMENSVDPDKQASSEVCLFLFSLVNKTLFENREKFLKF